MEDIEVQHKIDILEAKVSKLVSLSVLTLESVMFLSNALMHTPDLPDTAKVHARQAFDGIQAHIDLLKEIASITEKGEKTYGE